MHLIPFPRKFIAASFAVMGLFWSAVSVTGEGAPQLLGVAVVSLLTSAVVLKRGHGRFMVGLLTSTALYNSVILIYQTYAAVLLMDFAPSPFAAAAFIGYLIATIVFGSFIFLIIFGRRLIIGGQVEASEESTESRD